MSLSYALIFTSPLFFYEPSICCWLACTAVQLERAQRSCAVEVMKLYINLMCLFGKVTHSLLGFIGLLCWLEKRLKLEKKSLVAWRVRFIVLLSKQSQNQTVE